MFLENKGKTVVYRFVYAEAVFLLSMLTEIPGSRELRITRGTHQLGGLRGLWKKKNIKRYENIEQSNANNFEACLWPFISKQKFVYGLSFNNRSLLCHMMKRQKK